MIYVTKEGLSDELNGQITEIRKSEKWKQIKENQTSAIRDVFNHEFPKSDVKAVLIREQHGLCAYCMKRIKMDSHSRVEHLIPLSADKEKAIDYYNMVGVCDGGEKKKSQQGHILCCDANKGEIQISISPLNKSQMDKIAYKADGTICTVPRDDAMEKDINETLLLNGVRKQDGTVRDTATELLKGRRDAYDRARRMMDSLNRSGKCTSKMVWKIISDLQEQEEMEEYVGVKLYYFYRKHAALVRRGL